MFAIIVNLIVCEPLIFLLLLLMLHILIVLVELKQIKQILYNIRLFCLRFYKQKKKSLFQNLICVLGILIFYYYRS